MKQCARYQAPKHTYLQQLTAIAKRAHTWAFIRPLSQVTVPAHSRVTYHPAVRF